MKNVIKWVDHCMGIKMLHIRQLDAEGTFPSVQMNSDVRYTQYKVTVMGNPEPGAVCNVPSLESVTVGHDIVKVILVKTFDPYSASYRDLLDAINKDNCV